MSVYVIQTGGKRNAKKFFLQEKLMGRFLSIERRIILKRILEKQIARVWTGSEKGPIMLHINSESLDKLLKKTPCHGVSIKMHSTSQSLTLKCCPLYRRIHWPSELMMVSSGGVFFIRICAEGNSVCSRWVNAPIRSYSRPRYTNSLFCGSL